MALFNILKQARVILDEIRLDSRHNQLENKEDRYHKTLRFRKIFQSLHTKYISSDITVDTQYEKVRVLYAIYGLLLSHQEVFRESHAAAQSWASSFRATVSKTPADDYSAFLSCNIHKLTPLVDESFPHIEGTNNKVKLWRNRDFPVVNEPSWFSTSTNAFELELSGAVSLIRLLSSANTHIRSNVLKVNVGLGGVNLVGFALGGPVGLAATAGLTYYFDKKTGFFNLTKDAVKRPNLNINDCRIFPSIKAILENDGLTSQVTSLYEKASTANSLARFIGDPIDSAREILVLSFTKTLSDFNALWRKNPSDAAKGLILILQNFYSAKDVLFVDRLGPMRDLVEHVEITLNTEGDKIPDRILRALKISILQVNALLYKFRESYLDRMITDFSTATSTPVFRSQKQADISNLRQIQTHSGTAKIFSAAFKSGKPCLLKVIELSSPNLPYALTEANTLNLLTSEDNHPVIGFHGVIYSKGDLSLIFEMAQKLDLRHFAASDPTTYAQNLDSYVLDIAKGLLYLHERNIVHADIKPENVFVRSDNSIVLGDFGFSIDKMTLAYCPSTFTATEGYAPPEYLCADRSWANTYAPFLDLTGSDCKVDYPGDIWSFGTTVAVMYSSTISSDDDTTYRLHGRRIRTRFEASVSDNTVENGAFVIQEDNKLNDPQRAPVKSLVLNCLTIKPGKRITAEQAVAVLTTLRKSL